MSDQRTGYPQWASDAQVLAEIGRHLFSQPTRVTVRLSKRLADQARAAWERDDDDARRKDDETPDLRATRHRAGALALIGLAIAEHGKEDGDAIVVELDAWLIGDSLSAADEFGLLPDAPVHYARRRRESHNRTEQLTAPDSLPPPHLEPRRSEPDT